ncbi:hypothetical protein [Candidatus Nitrospira salsa]
MEACYATRDTQTTSLNTLLTILETDVMTAFISIQHIIESSNLTNDEKVDRIQQVFATRKMSQQHLAEVMTPLKASVEETQNQNTYYTGLETRSLRMQARLMPILKSLPWQGTDHALLAAIRYVQEHQGGLGHDAPRQFLTSTERKAVSPPDRPFRISLYKALLFIHVGQGLKAGTLFLDQSYKYRALEGYLLSRTHWQQVRDHYVQQAQLEAFANPQVVLGDLETHLHEQFVKTNTYLCRHQNEFVS